MRCTAVMLAVTFAAGIGLGLLAGQPIHGQPEGIKRTILLTTDLSGIDGREVVMGLAEVVPGVSAGRHYHHGDELGYLLEGTAVLAVEGQTPVTLKAGDTYHTEAKRIHDAKATGTTPAKVLAIWIVEKGQPLATPAP
jgi:quercetin dioxygenase-like cupin family protein